RVRRESRVLARSAVGGWPAHGPRAPRRPAFWLRVVPRKRTVAPVAGSATAASSRSTSIRALPIAKISGTAAHRRKEGYLITLGQLVRRIHVPLVDREADPYPSDSRLLANERFPHRADRRPGAQRTFLARSQSLAERGEESQLDTHRQSRTRCTMCPSWGTRSLLIASSTAPLEPGSDAITVRPLTPATARDSIAVAPISAYDGERRSSPKPSRRWSRRPATAS